MRDRELRLNSLSRYAKESPLFILEEHGHCEVPAGCGGVVLRWRDPRAGVPLRLWLYAAGECRFQLDGETPTSARPVVPYGEHVLAFAISDVDPEFIALMFAAVHHPTGDANVGSTPAQSTETSILSTADASWRYSLVEPAGDGWTRPGFDDTGWVPMTLREQRRPPPEEAGWDRDRYQVNRLRELGAAGLGVTGGSGQVWVRKSFVLSAPADPAAQDPSTGGPAR